MGSASQILQKNFMIILIIIFILISLHSSTDTLIAHASVSLDAAEDYTNVHGLQQHLYLMEERDQILKVSGEDENEQKEALIVQKFRALFGLKSLRTKRPSTGDSDYVSPSPSPSPTIQPEVPAPAPLLPIPLHSHHLPPRSNPIPPHHKFQNENADKGRARRILVPVLVSTGAAFLVCVLGLTWFCCIYRKQYKKSTGTMSVFRKRGTIKGKSKYLSYQKPASKVNSNPGLDLFYLNSLGIDLEQQTSSLKHSNDTVNTSSSNHSTPNYALHEREELNQELIKSESDNASTSSTREITSVHEDADSIKYETDGVNSSSGDKVVPIECHSSDDESFHSFGDSHSSNVRLSNASAGSLTDTQEIFSPNVTKKSSSLPSSTILSSPPPTRPPPPPPPPPPSVCFALSNSSSCSTKLASEASCSSTLPNLSPPRISDLSSGSNQTPQTDLVSSQKSSQPPQAPPGIPPPPCPPPFFSKNNNSIKGPPPPPSLLPQYTQLGKDGAPLPKLKPLHWDKVRAAPDRCMVWDKLRSSSFELDEEMIESLFGYNIQGSMKNDETKSKTPSPSKHVLEPKRLQNITILSKALNVTAEQVCNALMKGEGLSLQQLEALVRMVPTKEEEAKLSSYKENINELGSAEKFVKAMLGIPFAFSRVEVMLYRETFEDEVFHLRNSFSMLEEACKELRSSRLFLKLLEAVLKTGNRMNVGTIRGGARAFKLDALLKLADVKGTDGKTTLLHFVVQEIIRSEGIRVSDSIMGKINQRNKTRTVEEREEDYRRMGLDLVSGLSTELYNVKKTATIDLDVLASSVSNLSEGMTKLRHLVEKDLCLDEKSGMFVRSMHAFLSYAEKNLKEVQEDESRVLQHVREIREYFHGDVSKDEANPLRIFVIVRDFLGMLDHVCKELRNFKVPSSPSPLAPFR
ncbi:hypothetical protein JRO89_XSUnG0094500 [Xanthoceras sorbifolium]|uniref:Formin-like protein n=1 Tax=Xanthoceras sorbifolium TaxID=99658 RepID=A0ABQ8GYR8_9ROSI|nr:hypothetical protein JRO89_XSUnG0094500 [Xanthoceras sorbifolium]